ncbi:hypothetical protein ACRS5L_02480 [Metapseudomonas otitidis]|uniref:hypothetical protein n=1 Tax=Metapseudomonas otitidis TaxID=319939 RepID=UPI003EE378A6
MNDLAVIRSLFRWSRPVELPENHQWAHPDEPVLLEWRINARPYNTRVANLMFLMVLILAILVFLFFSSRQVELLLMKSWGGVVPVLFRVCLLFMEQPTKKQNSSIDLLGWVSSVASGRNCPRAGCCS